MLDAKAHAEARKLFGDAKPLTAHTKVGFGVGFTSDVTVAPARWTGGRQGPVRLTGRAGPLAHSRRGLAVKMGSFSARGDMDSSAGWVLVTGRSEARIETPTLALRQKRMGTEANPGSAPADPLKALPAVNARGR